MRAAILGAVLAAALSGAAHAQSSPPAASAAPTQTAPTESQIAAALDLLDATNAMSNMTQMINTMMNYAMAEVKAQHPDLADADIERYKNILSDEFVSREPELKRAIAVVYAQHFSEADLHALADFYRSELGKRYIATLPAMIKDMTPAGMAWGRQLAREALEKFLKTLPKNQEHA
ncbi:MAG: DUF2059 domain-containing protein [Alphaproteobacteria bacterium]|nr:DUF2059 domain-containing protein [Alphaproteobacteria bacterium]MBV9694516.1 DUF2059 domain-containing protein [Alphaproteobacteria bacterium]